MLKTVSVSRDIILSRLAPFGMSLVDSTAAIQRALDRGGVVEMPLTGGPWPISNLTMDVEGTELRLNGGTLIGIAGSTGTMVSADAAGCRAVGPGTIDSRPGSYTIAANFTEDETAIWNIKVLGNLFDPRLPNATKPTPSRLVQVRAAGDTKILAGVSVKGVHAIGGVSGICWAGARDSECIDCTGENNSPGQAIQPNLAGFPPVNMLWEDNTAIGSGYYGFPGTSLSAGAISAGWGIPEQGTRMTGFRFRHCAWAAYFGTPDHVVGTAKYGMDWTTSDNERGTIDASFYNNMAGGIEIKCGSDVSGIVQAGSPYNALTARLKVYMAMDYGVGVSAVNANDTEPASNFSNSILDACDFWYIGCSPWTEGLRQEVWSPVKSNGWNWLMVSPEPGVAGSIAPTGGGFAQTTTSGVTALGSSSLVVASATGIAIGRTIFVSGAGLNYLADGATVTNVAGTTISLSSNVLLQIPSGKSIVFAQEHYDGNLWWRAWQATPATDKAVNATAISTKGTTGLLVRGGSVTNINTVALVDGDASSDNAVADLTIHSLKVRGASNFVQMQSTPNDGTGSTQVDLHDCDIVCDGSAATRTGVLIASKQTSRLRMFGGRIVATGGSSIGIRQNSTTSGVNCTIELRGGAYIESVTAVRLDSNATPANTVYAVDFDNCTVIGSGGPNLLNGSGTINFGAACRMETPTGNAAWTTTGTVTVTGSPLRTNRSTTPTSSTAGAIGERFLLAAPTQGVYGYYCTAASGGVYGWEALSTSVPSGLRRASASVNFNSANTDTTVVMALPTGYTRYIVREVWLSGFSASGTTATCGLFTAAAAGGTAIVTSATAITVSTASEGAANNSQLLAIATGATQSFTSASLFFRVQTAQGSACTGNVTIVYEPLS